MQFINILYEAAKMNPPPILTHLLGKDCKFEYSVSLDFIYAVP